MQKIIIQNYNELNIKYLVASFPSLFTFRKIHHIEKSRKEIYNLIVHLDQENDDKKL